MAQKIILVTGGAGFIGSNLVEQLVKDKNNRVISLDNYFTGTKDNHISGAEYKKGHTKDIQKHIKIRPDIIYHLGEYSRVAASLEEPSLVWDLNIAGTLGVLEFWRAHKCKLVYAGSSTKFSQGRENDIAGKDLAPYTWAKAANTELIKNYSRWYGLDYSTVYFYNVYGPRERAGQSDRAYGTVIETFKQAYLSKKPYEVREPGTQTRAFTHVVDTVSGLILAGEKGERAEYGICAAEVYSLLDVAQMFGGEVKMLPATKSSRSSGAIDSVAIKALGWSQKNTLADYIAAIKKSGNK
ncbi:MAG: ADP-L-glycero-D-manno-heptose-6-epimerase [Parcubacteria group bacterium]|nr:MAG: ADP-L-glycero-D-manno-heptose-6-epimerase [Parcubacteria group bacterium]